jgi:hypothetical protein
MAPERYDEAKTADKSGAAPDRRATEEDSAAFETANFLDRAAEAKLVADDVSV